MKNLKDIILEKLKIDDIALSNKKFPIDGTLKDIVKFLKDNNFIIINDDTKAQSKIFNTVKSKCFTYINDTKRIWFADTSKKEICKDNPIFFINTKIKYYEVYYLDSPAHTEKIIDNDKEAFIEELNKVFGWE